MNEWQPAIVIDPYPEEKGSADWNRIVGQRVMIRPSSQYFGTGACRQNERCDGRYFDVSPEDAKRLGVKGPIFKLCEHQILTD